MNEENKLNKNDKILKRSDISYYAKENKKLSYTVDVLFVLWLLISLFYHEIRFNSVFIALGLILASSTFFLPYFYDKKYSKIQNVDFKTTRSMSYHPQTEKVFFVDDIVKRKKEKQTFQVMKVDYRKRTVETDTNEIIPFEELNLVKNYKGNV